MKAKCTRKVYVALLDIPTWQYSERHSTKLLDDNRINLLAYPHNVLAETPWKIMWVLEEKIGERKASSM